MGSFLDVSNWLNPAKLTLYYQTNSSTQWIRDYCGQRTTEPCEQICNQDTGWCMKTFADTVVIKALFNRFSPCGKVVVANIPYISL